MPAVASPRDLTVEDFDTPIERALHLAESINVDVSSFPTDKPSEVIDQTLALLFLTGGGDDPAEEGMIIRDDAGDGVRRGELACRARLASGPI